MKRKSFHESEKLDKFQKEYPKEKVEFNLISSLKNI